jgi:thymidylate kinase
MAEPKLFFVEGMTGAGKSTTAGNTERFLDARGSRGHSLRQYAPVQSIWTIFSLMSWRSR